MDFHRLRVGIGRDGSDAAEYVLGRLSPHELQFWGQDGQGSDMVCRELERTIQGILRPR